MMFFWHRNNQHLSRRNSSQWGWGYWKGQRFCRVLPCSFRSAVAGSVEGFLEAGLGQCFPGGRVVQVCFFFPERSLARARLKAAEIQIFLFRTHARQTQESWGPGWFGGLSTPLDAWLAKSPKRLPRFSRSLGYQQIWHGVWKCRLGAARFVASWGLLSVSEDGVCPMVTLWQTYKKRTVKSPYAING